MQQLVTESASLEDYLEENNLINYFHPLIKNISKELFDEKQSEMEKVQIAFEFVRDEIAHSWDIQSERVTISASDVLHHETGICYAKSNLLAALLRAEGIPAGFCYQRLLLFDTPEKGHCIHALNGVYMHSLNKWIRLDARGNKPGIQAEFSAHSEKLAFKVNEELSEVDYPIIYVKPNPKTIKTLKKNTNAIEMYKHNLPDSL